jgi:hypothetical protein
MPDRDFILQCLVPLTQAGTAISEYELYCRITYGIKLQISADGALISADGMAYMLSNSADLAAARLDSQLSKFLSYELSTINVIYKKFAEVAKRRAYD